MAIYTKNGDFGETLLFGGTKVAKDSLRVCCYGTVDEVCSILGVAYAALTVPEIKEIVHETQKKLFILGAQLASDGSTALKTRITAKDTAYLENIIDTYTAKHGELKEFTIPGETVCSALFHVARTVIRRCEREVAALARNESVSDEVLKFINRLSDFFYILALMEIAEHDDKSSFIP